MKSSRSGNHLQEMRSERFLNFSYKLLTFSFTNLNLPNCMNRNSRAPRSEATHLPKARCLVHPHYHISIYKQFRFRIRMRNAFEFPTYFLFVLSTSVGFRSSHRSLIFFFSRSRQRHPRVQSALFGLWWVRWVTRKMASSRAEDRGVSLLN